MNSNFLVLYENPTPNYVSFIFADSPSFSESTSSTRSDAQSAPPDLNHLFYQLCEEYSRCVHETGRVLPPEWNMPDLVRAVLGDESLQQGFLTDAYYDVMLCGTHSWACEELLNFLDLIHYF
jgi:hypothetical protein